MNDYIERTITDTVKQRLDNNPAVALLGARQVGKSTLAKHIISQYSNSLYLDLERTADLNKLTEAEAFFQLHRDKLICLDEIQKSPEIFSVMRSVIDNRQDNGQFLILGSASRDLIQQSSETLAGRLSYLDVTPFTRNEISANCFMAHWLRGGYPRSLLVEGNENSVQWREDYIKTFLERDIPQLGFNIPAATLGRFWRMVAHTHGQLLNSNKFADSMGVSGHTIRKYIDLLEQTFVLRTLTPFENNLKKRLVKSPKVYIRDSGLLHSLLDIETFDELFAHPVYGASYEGYVIENIISALPRWQHYFYRTSNGAEIDLVLQKGRQLIAIEIKSSKTPKPSRGFWQAIKDLHATHAYVVAPVEDNYPLSEGVQVVSLDWLLASI